MNIFIYNGRLLQGISDQCFWLCPALYALVGAISITLVIFTGILLFSKRYNPILQKQKEDSEKEQQENIQDVKQE